jgi:hypothetical protein
MTAFTKDYTEEQRMAREQQLYKALEIVNSQEIRFNIDTDKAGNIIYGFWETEVKTEKNKDGNEKKITTNTFKTFNIDKAIEEFAKRKELDLEEWKGIFKTAIQIKEFVAIDLYKIVKKIHDFAGNQEVKAKSLQKKNDIASIRRRYGKLRHLIFSNGSKLTKQSDGSSMAFIPKVFNKEQFIHNYVEYWMLNDTKKKIEDLYSEAEILFGDKEYINPLRVSDKYYTNFNNDTKRIDIAFNTFITDLVNSIKNDLTLMNWYSYQDAAFAYGESDFMIEKTHKWFKNQSQSQHLNTVTKDKSKINDNDNDL